MSAMYRNNVPALALIVILSVLLMLEVRWIHRSWASRGWVYEWVSSWTDAARAPSEKVVLQVVTPIPPAGLEVRLAALHALAQEGSSEATRALIHILTTEAETDLRRHAAYALGERGDAEAVEALLNVALSRTSAEVRKAAVHALGQIQSTEAQDALLQVVASYTSNAEARP